MDSKGPTHWPHSALKPKRNSVIWLAGTGKIVSETEKEADKKIAYILHASKFPGEILHVKLGQDNINEGAEIGCF